MTEQDLLRLRDLAEAGQVQFKERIVGKGDKYEIGCEMVAFSNSRGGGHGCALFKIYYFADRDWSFGTHHSGQTQ